MAASINSGDGGKGVSLISGAAGVSVFVSVVAAASDWVALPPQALSPKLKTAMKSKDQRFESFILIHFFENRRSGRLLAIRFAWFVFEKN